MDAHGFSSDQLTRLLLMVERIYETYFSTTPDNDRYIDNQELILKMGISKRTAHNWRIKRLIPYTRVGRKFFYRLSDVQQILKSNFLISKHGNR